MSVFLFIIQNMQQRRRKYSSFSGLFGDNPPQTLPESPRKKKRVSKCKPTTNSNKNQVLNDTTSQESQPISLISSFCSLFESFFFFFFFQAGQA